MKYTHLISLLLFFAILVLALFLSGRQINSKIEKTIRENYEKDIQILKDKINKHSELISSIINIKDKEEEAESTDDAKDESTNASGLEFEYIKTDGGIAITKYTGSKTSVTIPNKIDGSSVVKINENAFSDTRIKSITLPVGCKEIDWFAFYGCFALTTVYVPSAVEIIGYGAFDGCSKALVIYCENGSFAEQYAQSFGINYSNFK